MGKQDNVKRLVPMSHAAASSSKSIDSKARKRIEELYNLTEEIIDSYNELSNQLESGLYRKYKQLQDINKNLQTQLDNHHCATCNCRTRRRINTVQSKIDDDDDDEEETNYATPAATATNKKTNNPFIISDIEDTQYFDDQDSRLADDDVSSEQQQADDDNDDDDKISMDTAQNGLKSTTTDDEESEQKSEGELDEDDGDCLDRLPLALRDVIRKKARKNKNAKSYLLKAAHYPSLCEFLTDKSRSSFDHRPSEKHVRPLIQNHLSRHFLHDTKIRMRIRDELRELHRSYMRTFMNDPRAGQYKHKPQTSLITKKSPT